MSTESPETSINQVVLPGGILKAAREEKGLTVEEMSAISNLTKQVIRGIEANEYGELAGLSFVRGYLKLYAKKLGVDEARVLEPFDAWKRIEQGDAETASSTGSGTSSAAYESGGVPSTRWFAVGGVVIVSLIVAGVVISMGEREDASAVALPEPTPLVEPVRPADEISLDSNSDEGLGDAETAQITSEASGSLGTDESASEESTATEDRDVTNPALPSDTTVEPVANESTENVADPVTESAAPDAEVVETETSAPEVAEPEVTEPEVTEPIVAEPVETNPEPTAEIADSAPSTPPENDAAEAASDTVRSEASETPPVVSNIAPGRVVAEAENLDAPTVEPTPPETQVSPGDDRGLRVLSETVTGPNPDDLAMGARGLLEMRFSGESWVEVRDARGRLVVADLMEAGRFVSLQTFGPVEVLIGAVSDSTVIFNGETLDLSNRSYQNVARVTLGAVTN